MKIYDFAKAKELALKLIEKEEISNISLGMHRDWFWTADEIWEKEKGFLIDLDNVECIGGIEGSDWDFPVLRVLHTDGHVEEWEVWKPCNDPKELEMLEKRCEKRRQEALSIIQSLKEEGSCE